MTHAALKDLTPAEVLREFSADGRLQTFEDRQRFRAASIAALSAMDGEAVSWRDDIKTLIDNGQIWHDSNLDEAHDYAMARDRLMKAIGYGATAPPPQQTGGETVVQGSKVGAIAAAEQDARISGTGFLVDGFRVAPDRVQMVATQPQQAGGDAVPESVAAAFRVLTRDDSTPQEIEARMFLMRCYTTPPQPEAGGGVLTFEAFRSANVARCIKWHPEGIASWSPSDWLVAAMGELGELASEVKTFNRERDGLAGNKQQFSPEERKLRMANEAADVVTYLDLFCAERGINLGAAVVRKFNEVSERVGFPDRISTTPASGGEHGN